MNEIKAKNNNVLDIVPTNVLIALYRYFNPDKNLDYSEYLRKKMIFFKN